jgi:hypothetical protein
MSTVYVAIAVALTCIGWSLWQRRITWTCTWEWVVTLAVTFQGLGMILAAPATGTGLTIADRVLHSLTGLWGLNALIGGLFFVGAAAGFAYTALSRALPTDQLARLTPRLIRFPAAASAAVLVVTYAVSDLSARPNTMDVVSSPAMRIYWSVLCLVKIYLLLGAGAVLWLLRRAPRHRTVANLYLFACVNGIAVCLARAAATFGPQAFRAADVWAVWAFGSLWGAGFALAAAYSWQRKTRPFRNLMGAVRV